jgi:hypothetical protein
MAYLIDTDVFIAAKNLHYGMDFCPAFWDWLAPANASHRLLSIRAVFDDLAAGEDELADWAKARDEGFFVPPAGPDLVALGRVAQFINDQQTYTAAAKQGFLACSDYFVVSQALAGGHTVITHEKPENSVNRIKIPSVCVALGISYTTPWQMLRTERARFVLQALSASV